MNKFEQMVANLTSDEYQNVKRAIELGKWPDGNKVNEEQRDMLYQVLIAYELKNNLAEEDRTGYIDKGSKAGTNCDKPNLSYEL